MKTYFLSLLFLIGLGATAHSQSRQKDPKPYRAWVTLTNGQKFKGILYDATKDSIVLLNARNSSKQVFRPEQVEWLKLRIKNRTGNGALIGTASGALLGGLVAAVGSRESDFVNIDMVITIEGPDAVEPEDTFVFILGGAVLGSITGAAVASKRIKYFINGERGYYLSKLPGIHARSLVGLANPKKISFAD